MGLHQDMDEADQDTPVLSISLGDTAVFRLGGPSRRDPDRTMRLAPATSACSAEPRAGSFTGWTGC